MINRDNYIEYMLDYLDGTLSGEQEKMFLNFLENHPEVKAEMEEFTRISLSPGEVIFTDKESLKKQPSEQVFNKEEFDFHSVAMLEGDLDDQSQKEFISYLSVHQDQAGIVELFKSTRLIPDSRIEYPDKSALKKFFIPKYIRKITIATLSSAAAILIGFLLFWYNPIEEIDSLVQHSQVPVVFEGTLPEITISPDTQVEDKLAAVTIIQENPVNTADNKGGQEVEWNKEPPLVPINSKPAGFISASYKSNAQIMIVYSGRKDGEEYLSVPQYLGSKIFNIEPEKLEPEKINSERTIQHILVAGVRGFNRITGDRIHITTSFYENGELESIGVESPSLAFNRPIKKNE